MCPILRSRHLGYVSQPRARGYRARTYVVYSADSTCSLHQQLQCRQIQGCSSGKRTFNVFLYKTISPIPSFGGQKSIVTIATPCLLLLCAAWSARYAGGGCVAAVSGPWLSAGVGEKLLSVRLACWGLDQSADGQMTYRQCLGWLGCASRALTMYYNVDTVGMKPVGAVSRLSFQVGHCSGRPCKQQGVWPGAKHVCTRRMVCGDSYLKKLYLLRVISSYGLRQCG